MVDIDFRLASPMMRAEDLFRYKNGFLLPETYRTEYLEDFQVSGKENIAQIMGQFSSLLEETKQVIHRVLSQNIRDYDDLIKKLDKKLE